MGSFVFRPLLESVESRIMLSTLAPQPRYVHHEKHPNLAVHVHHPVTPIGRAPVLTPMDIVVNIAANTNSPVLGGTINLSLTTTPAPNFVITGTMWTYNVTYSGVTSAYLTPQSPGLLNATVYLSVPGTYTVTAVTTYRDSNPSGPSHAPTKVTTTFTVPPPSAIAKDGGVNTPIPIGALDQLVDDINTPNGPLGSFAPGLFQENLTNVASLIPNFLLASGWGPSGYGQAWNVNPPHL